MQHDHADVADALAAEMEELTGDAVIVVDQEDRIVRWSARSVALFGLAADAAVRRCANEILPFPKRADLAQLPIECLLQGKPWAAAPDYASKTPLLWSARPLRTPAGAVIGGYYRVRAVQPPRFDRTERGDASEALRAFDVVFESVVVLDRQHKVLAFHLVTNPVRRLRSGLPDSLGDSN